MVYDNNEGQDKNIRGKALYFGTSQVADILNISDSRVRYYTNVFKDILHIEISNKQRRYTQADIDKMRFMIELKEDGMTLKQIQEYCQEVDFQDSKEIQVKENNPLGIQAIAKALLEQQSLLMTEMKQDIINSVVKEFNGGLAYQNNQFDEMRRELNKDVAITVDDGLEKINKKLEQRDIGLVENLRESLKDEKIKALEKEIEELKAQQQTGFLSKFFSKKK
jgi:DNA-binding transcriptional MerR regulator